MTAQPGPARDLVDEYTPRAWCDRLGSIHVERARQVPPHDAAVPRVPTPLGVLGVLDAIGGEDAPRSGVLTNPLISTDPDAAAAGGATRGGEPPMRLYTWIVDAPGASAVLLWGNGLFDHTDVGASELERVPAGNRCAGRWTITLRLPADWRGSYRIAIHEGPGEAPWRSARGRHAIRRAAIDGARVDPLGSQSIRGSGGQAWSVAAGPAAPAESWRLGGRADQTGGSSHPHGLVDELAFPADGPRPAERAWVYRPAAAAAGNPERTPVLVLFDGQVWKDGLDLPAAMDAVIARGLVAPLHVVMVDSHDEDTRWAHLGVPGGQVDAVLDRILPQVRAAYPVSPRGCDTAVAGQSLGGLAALWTVALAEGRVDHAIAQSPSLWRFPVAAPLLREPRWRSIRLQAGTLEGEMLQDALDLEQRLSFDPLAGCRSISVQPVHGGHDWAWWRVGLVEALRELFPAGPAPGES
ncbi:alpha/beta hydrolase-fold protein [Schaalia naturae]|uniref:Alpha/beta hydrolase-fold protein n=1 Tax=Schaalia naturae TaxID=635203 RepID=A0ABW2SJI5_9ACTO